MCLSYHVLSSSSFLPVLHSAFLSEISTFIKMLFYIEGLFSSLFSLAPLPFPPLLHFPYPLFSSLSSSSAPLIFPLRLPILSFSQALIIITFLSIILFSFVLYRPLPTLAASFVHAICPCRSVMVTLSELSVVQTACRGTCAIGLPPLL